MSRDVSYYESAITYNERLANAASEVSKELENDEIKRWALGVAKQHRIHTGRHKRALARLLQRAKGGTNEETQVNEEQNTQKSITEEQAEYAARQEQKNVAGGGGSADPEDRAPQDDAPTETPLAEAPTPGAGPTESAPDPEQAAPPVDNVGAGVETMDADTNGLGENPETDDE